MLTSLSLEGSICSASRSANRFPLLQFNFPVFKNDDHGNGTGKNKKPEHDLGNIQSEMQARDHVPDHQPQITKSQIST